MSPDFDLSALMPSMTVIAAIALVLYVYMAFVLSALAAKTHTPDGWMAWVPILNLILLCRIAGKSGAFVLLFFIPIVNLFAIAMVWMAIARIRGKSEALGVLMLVPVVNFIVPLMLLSGPASPGPGSIGAIPPQPQYPPHPQYPNSGPQQWQYQQPQYQQPQQQAQYPPVCPACGRPECVGGEFCGYTGQPIRGFQQQQQQQQQQPPPPYQQQVYPTPPLQPPRPASSSSAPLWIGVAVVVLVLLGGAYFLFGGGSGGGAKPGDARPVAGRITPRMAGTLKEFPVDNGPKPARPTAVVASTLGGKSSTNLPPKSLPPGIGSPQLSQVGTSAVTATYQGDPGSTPVAVTVIETNGQNPQSSTWGASVAQVSGPEATTTGVDVRSPSGTDYNGVLVRTATSVTYILDKIGAPVIIIIYVADPNGFETAKRLAGNVGNGQGLLDDPEAAYAFGALPQVPPGVTLIETQSYSGDGLVTSLDQLKTAFGSDFGPDGGRMFEQIRSLIPRRLIVARYQDARQREMSLAFGEYGTSVKAWTTWAFLRFVLGAGGGQTVPIDGGDGLQVISDDTEFVLFRKGSALGIAGGPRGTPSLQLARGAVL